MRTDLWFDKDGQPIPDEQAFALRYGQPPGAVSEYARIGLDVVGESKVSTVWLGLNHEFRPDRPPLIFETMIFGGQYADYCERYATEAQAAAGHAAVVAALVAGQAPPGWEDS
jgi:hypothetical protein